MRDERESNSHGPLNPWLVPSLAFVFVAIECATLALMMRGLGIRLPLGWLAVSFALSLAPGIVLGFLARAIVEGALGRGREYLRIITGRQYVLLTILLFSTLLLQVVF